MTVYTINPQGQAIKGSETEDANSPARVSFDERVQTVEARLRELRETLKNSQHPPPAMRPAPQTAGSFLHQVADIKAPKIVTLPTLPANANQKPFQIKWSVSHMGAIASASWLGIASYFISSTVGWSGLFQMPLSQLGSVIAGLSAPPALLWMILAHIQRNDDFKALIQPLVDQLKQLTFPAKDSEARVRALTDSLKQQANELTAAAEKVESTIGRARQALRAETTAMQKAMNNTGVRLEQTSNLLVERSSKMAKLSDLIEGRMSQVEQSALKGSVTLEMIVNSMVERAADSTMRFEQQVGAAVSSLYTANGRIIQVADEIGKRMHSLQGSAVQAADMFGDVSSRFAGHEAALDLVSDKIEGQMQRLEQQFEQQFTGMTALMNRFSAMGGEIGDSVRGFREAADAVVTQAIKQISGMSESFESRSADVQAALDRAAGQTLTQIQGFDQQFADRLLALQDRLADAASTTPEMIKEIMHEVTRQLLNIEMRFAQTGQATRQQIAAIEDQLGQSLQSLDRIATSMGDQAANTVRQSVSTLAGQLHGLRDSFAESAQVAQKDLKTFHGDLAQTIEGLSIVARQATDRTVERILQLNASVAQRIMDMREASEIAGEQNEKFTSQMVNHIGLMRGLHDQMSQHAEKITHNGDRMSGNLMEATAAARAQSDIISEKLVRDTEYLRQELSVAMSQLENALELLSREGADLYIAGSVNVQHLREVTQDMRAERVVLEHTAITLDQAQSSLQNQLGSFGEVVHSLKTELGDVLSASGERLDQFKQVGEIAKGAAQSLMLQVNSGISQLDESAARLISDAQDLQAGMRQQSQEIAITAGQVAQQSEAALSNYSRFVQRYGQDSQQFLHDIQQSLQTLQKEGGQISLLTDRSARDITWLTEMLGGAGEKIQQAGDEAISAIRKTGRITAEQTAALQSQAISSTAALQKMASVAEQETSSLAERSAYAAQAYQVATDTLREMGMEVSTLSFRAHDELGELSRNLQNIYDLIANGGAANMQQLEAMQQRATHMHQELLARTEAAQQQLQSVEHQLQEAGVDVGLVTDQAIQKVYGMKQQLNHASQEALATATEAAGQIASAAQMLINQGQQIVKQGSEIRSTIQAASSLQQQQLESVALTSQQTRSAVMAEVEQLRQLAQQLAQTAQHTVGEFAQQHTRLGQAQQQLVQNAQQNIQAMAQAGHVAQQQWQGLQQQQQQTNGQLQQTTQVLDGQVATIKAAVAAAQTVLLQAGQTLAQQADQTLKAMSTANQRGQGLAELLGRQLAEIQQVSQEAVSQTERLQDHSLRQRRELFLGNAKQVIEGLHSLSIDLTKALDPQAQHQDWRAIANGDLGTFTKRLLGIKEDIPAQKIREKYWQNAEFRSAVMRYLRQFEELFGQALQIDTADLLAATLMTSDIGKLYTYLATALDHQQLPQKAVA